MEPDHPERPMWHLANDVQPRVLPTTVPPMIIAFTFLWRLFTLARQLIPDQLLKVI